MQETTWVTCPNCGQKLAKAGNAAECNGVFIKCKKCREEVEIKVPARFFSDQPDYESPFKYFQD